jgi:beta-galactosidase
MTDVLHRTAPQTGAAPGRMPAPWVRRPAGLCYGGDYNPEQWPREVWVEDIALMKEAGINLVSVGIFSWVLLEPREGEYDFEWLDHLMDLLHGARDQRGPGHAHGSPAGLVLEEVSAGPSRYPRGCHLGQRIQGHGKPQLAGVPPRRRQHHGAAGPPLRNAPALVLWHVHNEYGAPVSDSYDDSSVAAFRDWLQARYGTLEELNNAWGTLFWGQKYGEWDEIDAPRLSASVSNQAQRLDFRRFTSDALP